MSREKDLSSVCKNEASGAYLTYSYELVRQIRQSPGQVWRMNDERRAGSCPVKDGQNLALVPYLENGFHSTAYNHLQNPCRPRPNRALAPCRTSVNRMNGGDFKYRPARVNCVARTV